jgi:hypothetical protein
VRGLALAGGAAGASVYAAAAPEVTLRTARRGEMWSVLRRLRWAGVRLVVTSTTSSFTLQTDGAAEVVEHLVAHGTKLSCSIPAYTA